jgi:hypothetical protein
LSTSRRRQRRWRCGVAAASKQRDHDAATVSALHPDDGEFGTGVQVLNDLADAVALTTKIAATPALASCR